MNRVHRVCRLACMLNLTQRILLVMTKFQSSFIQWISVWVTESYLAWRQSLNHFDQDQDSLSYWTANQFLVSESSQAKLRFTLILYRESVLDSVNHFSPDRDLLLYCRVNHFLAQWIILVKTEIILYVESVFESVNHFGPDWESLLPHTGNEFLSQWIILILTEIHFYMVQWIIFCLSALDGDVIRLHVQANCATERISESESFGREWLQWLKRLKKGTSSYVSFKMSVSDTSVR